MRHLTKFRGLKPSVFNKTFATISTEKIPHQESTKNEEKTTHFGFQTVSESEKAKKVHQVFKSVAHDYDIMNDVMSVGIHRVWKDIFMQRLSPSLGTKLLDVAGGTGDIAFRYVNYLLNLPGKSKQCVIESGSHVTVTDINASMLDVGKERALELGLPSELLSWKVEDGEKLSFKNDEFSAYTISFGIRNFTNIENALAEAYRVLKPGGRFMCLEFSQLNNSTAQWLYDQYSFKMIPIFGQLISGKFEPYQYLVESIRKFPDQETFKLMIEEAGFRSVTYENLTMGICAIHSGFKL